MNTPDRDRTQGDLAAAARPLLRGLAALRRRARALMVLLGASRVVLFLVGTLVCFFFADYFLRLPLWVRGCLLVAVTVGALVVLQRRLLRPLARPLDDDRLAGRVEATHPQLQDRLRSSLAFVRARPDDPDNEDSPELMRLVVEETVRLTAPLRFTDVARRRIPARWAAGAGALLLATTLAAAAQSGLVGTFVQRSLLLRDVAWPRRTTLEVVGMTPGAPRRITRGRDVTLQVRATGTVPDRVDFVYWEADAQGRPERVELTPTAEDVSLFAITLPVYTSYRFTVAGGDDDREEVYAIEALTPPAILDLEVDCTYPAYLAMPDATLRGGDQRVPEGTRVTVRLHTNMPVRTARVALGGEEPLDLVRDAEDRFHFEIDGAKRDLRYSIRLVGRDGEENDPGVDTFVLRVARDQAPLVRIHTPSARTGRLARGVVLIAFTAQDDHRIQRAELHYRVREEDERVIAVGESGGSAIRILQASLDDPGRLVGVAAIDLGKLLDASAKPVKKGDRITYYLNVADSSGQVQRTRTDYQIECVSEEDLSQTVQARQQELRESVQRTHAQARDAHDMREDVTPESDVASRRKLSGRAQARQARVIDDLGSIARQVQGLLNLYVFNRLGDASGADQILPFYERHLLEPDERGGTPFRGSLYHALWSAHTERVIRGGSAHVKLLEMADLAERLAVDHGPRAYRALGDMGKATGDAAFEQAMRDAAAEQRTILDGLDRLRTLMSEWENFESVVRFFKGLRDTEKGVVDELGGDRRDKDK